jgi:hypothetical protein
MAEYIFTFSYLQRHPVTGERLEDKFTRVKGRNFKEARRNAIAIWGYRWAEQFESEYQAQVKEKGLTEIETLDKEEWVGGGRDGEAFEMMGF